jgi:protein TonB
MTVNIIKKLNYTLLFGIMNTSLLFSQKVKVVDISPPATQKNEPTIMIGAPGEGVVKTKPDIQPEFKGGPAALSTFVSKNLKYPKEAVDHNIQGLLLVKLSIGKDGVAKFDEFIRKLGYGCEEEALRIISKMPKWNPALLAGKPIDSEYILRVTFKLSD